MHRRIRPLLQRLKKFGTDLERDCPRVRENCRVSSCGLQDGEVVIELRRGASDHWLYHEFGHFLLVAYQLSKCSPFRRFFRKKTDNYISRVMFFRAADVVAKAFKMRPKNHASMYALVDGKEDFAECFALLVELDFDPRQAHSDHLKEKLAGVLQMLKYNCRGRPKSNLCRRK